MKVLVITGSPRREGTTAALAAEFIRGAEEAGHQVSRFDAAFRQVHPCVACDTCRRTGRCVFRDDMEALNPLLLEADVVALVSPVYYFSLSAQLKSVIDRFYAHDDALHGGKRAVLLAAMADGEPETAEGIQATFAGIAGYLEWEIAGTVIGAGCAGPDELRKTEYPKQAYTLGREL